MTSLQQNKMGRKKNKPPMIGTTSEDVCWLCLKSSTYPVHVLFDCNLGVQVNLDVFQNPNAIRAPLDAWIKRTSGSGRPCPFSCFALCLLTLLGGLVERATGLLLKLQSLLIRHMPQLAKLPRCEGQLPRARFYKSGSTCLLRAMSFWKLRNVACAREFVRTTC